MTEVVIQLEKPLLWHGGQIAEIVLREPTGQEFIDLGEPRTLVGNAAGSAFWADLPQVIKAYLQACIRHEGAAVLLAQMSFNDARRLKAALLDFFRPAEGSASG